MIRSFTARTTLWFAALVTGILFASLAVGGWLLNKQMLAGLELLHEVESEELGELLGDNTAISTAEIRDRIAHDADGDAELFLIQVRGSDGGLRFRSENLEDAVRVFFHLRQGEHAADAGHAVDVGEKHGVMFIEPFRTFALEETIGVFTGAHGEADDDVAHVGPGRNVGIALVLIFDREGSELVSDDVGIGGGGTSSAIQECE